MASQSKKAAAAAIDKWKVQDDKAFCLWHDVSATQKGPEGKGDGELDGEEGGEGGDGQ